MKRVLLPLLASLLALPTAATAQNNDIVVVAPKKTDYTIYKFDAAGACTAAFAPVGTKQVFMVSNFQRRSIVIQVIDKSLGLKALKQYDVALRRGDVRVLEWGRGMMDESKIPQMVNDGIGTEIQLEPLKQLATSNGGRFSYSIVVKGRDVELFALDSAEFEEVVTQLLACGYQARYKSVWDEIISIEPYPVQPTPEELGIGDGNMKPETTPEA